MSEMKMEHFLLFVVAAFLLYHLLGNCGCRDGFRVGGQARKPSTSCVTCAGALLTTVGTTAGVDEIPIIGEGVMTAEFGTDLVACGMCGINVGEVSGCMYAKRNSNEDNDKKLCECEQKFCGLKM